MSIKYACTGMRLSCAFCSSYSQPDPRLGVWKWDEEWREPLKAKKNKGNWLVPAHMDVFTSDFPDSLLTEFVEELRNPAILDLIPGGAQQQFFLCTKNLYRMSEHWSATDHVVWSYSASNQDEVDFYSQIRFSAIAAPRYREALFLAPLTGSVVLPKPFLDHFEYIFIDGYRGKEDVPLDLRWAESISRQLCEAGSATKLIIEGVGDRPMLDGTPIKVKSGACWGKTIQEITGS